MRVLVVEDHPRILSFVKKGLEEDGFVVATAEDGHHEVQLCEAILRSSVARKWVKV